MSAADVCRSRVGWWQQGVGRVGKESESCVSLKFRLHLKL